MDDDIFRKNYLHMVRKYCVNVSIVCGIVFVLAGCNVEKTIEIHQADKQKSSVIEIRPALLTLPIQLQSEMREQLEQEFEFSVFNHSSDIIPLLFQGTDCGCIGIHYCGEVVDPNTLFQISPETSIALTMRFASPMTASGFSHRASFIPEVDRKQEKPIEFIIVGKIVPDVTLEPSSIQHNFFEGQSMEVIKTILITRNFRSDKLRKHQIPKFQSLPHSVQVINVKEKGRKIENGIVAQVWIAQLKVKCPNDDSSFSPVTKSQIVFQEENNSAPFIQNFSIYVHKKYGIDFPKRVLFGLCKVGDRLYRKIMLRSVDDQPFCILSAKCDSPLFNIKEIQQTPNKVQWIELSFEPQSVGHLDGSLELKTDHTYLKTIEIILEGFGK